MIGYQEMFAALAFFGLPCLGFLIANAHHRPAWTGLMLGILSFIALVSGWIIVLVVKDWLDRKRFPNRIGVGVLVVLTILLVFVASTVGCASIVLWIRSA